MKLYRYFLLFLYYCFAYYLPSSSGPFGRISLLVRSAICSTLFKKSAKHINIEKGAYFGDGSNLEIGEFSGLGKNCVLNGPVKLGRYVMMGPDVLILIRNHQFNWLDIPMALQGATLPKPVTIKDDVWIGARSVILPGVTVENGAIIAASSVVTKDIPAYAIVAGNPAINST